MENNRIIAYILIGVGVLFLLSRLDVDAGWLWVALVAAGFLWGYSARKSYGLLVAGSIFTGVAVGLLLEQGWGWNGAFLVSLGVGFVMIDRIEPKANRWPIYVGGVLALFGLIVGLSETGILGSFWFALVLIGAGAYLLNQDKKKEVGPTPGRTETLSETFVTVTPQPTETVAGSEETAPTAASPRADIPPAVETAPVETPPVITSPAPVQPVDTALYERLESWRRETARREGRAAYLVLTNESLRQIAAKKPQTLDDLKVVKGVGPVKLERYGEAILEVVQSA